MSAARGNPKITLRVPPDLMERAQNAFPAVTGRSGGVALALRQLLHLVLDEPIPEQYGEVRRREEIDSLEDIVRGFGSSPSADEVAWARARAFLLLKQGSDRLDVMRLRLVLGRLAELERGSSPD